MVDRDKIQFDLIKLLNGERILRLTEPKSGLALEQKLAPSDAVVRQKENFSAPSRPPWPGWNCRRLDGRRRFWSCG
ncbi:MAG: hypothetical protein ABSF10_05855 [Verrucomicrobiota bacterium]|jgi:hypothetical protein